LSRDASSVRSPGPGRMIVIITHSRRIDETGDWIGRGFSSSATNLPVYEPKPDMLETIPARRLVEHKLDPPLSKEGVQLAQRNAEAILERYPELKEGSIVISSPALSAMQTAKEFALHLGSGTKICVDNQLFECSGFYPPPKADHMRFLGAHEISAYGIPLDPRYNGRTKLQPNESGVNYLERSARFMQKLLVTVPCGHVILIGHRGTHYALGAPLEAISAPAPLDSLACPDFTGQPVDIAMDDVNDSVGQDSLVSPQKCDERQFAEFHSQYYATGKRLSACFTSVFRAHGNTFKWNRTYSGVPIDEFKLSENKFSLQSHPAGDLSTGNSRELKEKDGERISKVRSISPTPAGSPAPSRRVKVAEDEAPPGTPQSLKKKRKAQRGSPGDRRQEIGSHQRTREEPKTRAFPDFSLDGGPGMKRSKTDSQKDIQELEFEQIPSASLVTVDVPSFGTRSERDSKHTSVFPSAPPEEKDTAELDTEQSHSETTSGEDIKLPCGWMDVRDQYGRWSVANVREAMQSSSQETTPPLVDVHFAGWGSKFDEIIRWPENKDRFASMSRFSKMLMVSFDTSVPIGVVFGSKFHPRDLDYCAVPGEEEAQYNGAPKFPRITSVTPGSQADVKGIQAGWEVIRLFSKVLLPEKGVEPRDPMEADRLLSNACKTNVAVSILFFCGRRRSSWPFSKGESVMVKQRRPKPENARWICATVVRLEGEEVQVKYLLGREHILCWYHLGQNEILPLKSESTKRSSDHLGSEEVPAGACPAKRQMKRGRSTGDSEPRASSLRIQPQNLEGKSSKSAKPDQLWLENMLVSLKDGDVSPMFSTKIGSRDFDELEALRPRICRVGSHADGTCFFGSVFHSLNAVDPRMREKNCSSDLKGDGIRFREAGSDLRRKLGREWRLYLASRVSRDWFDRNLKEVITYDEYVQLYKNPNCSVGPMHNMHVASYYGVNIFFLIYLNPKTGKRDFSIRVCLWLKCRLRLILCI